MTAQQALAIIEQAFEEALAPQTDPEGLPKRSRDPKGARTKATIPKERGHIVPAAGDRKGGAQEQPIDVPKTVQEWHVNVAPSVLELSDAEAELLLQRAGRDLAAMGQGLGLDTFGRLEIKERGRAARKANEGVTNRRNATIVVYAKGWTA